LLVMVFIISFIFGFVKLFPLKISLFEICEVNHLPPAIISVISRAMPNRIISSTRFAFLFISTAF
jgi:hypothetical protein